MKRKRIQEYSGESSSDDGDEDLTFEIEGGEMVELGDTVVVRIPQSQVGDEALDETMVARVENIWKENPFEGPTPLFKFRARWFFAKNKIDQIIPHKLTLQHTQETYFSPYDLILTNQYDDNAAATISRRVQVIYRRPEPGAGVPTFPKDTYVCRFALAFGADDVDRSEIHLTPFSGQNDDWGELHVNSTKRRRLFSPRSAEETNVPSNSASDSDDSSSIHSPRAVRVDEGTIAQRDIRVGSKHQATVPRFIPNQIVVSREPTLVWKAQEVPKESLSQFLEQVASVLFPYLKENRLTQEEPYSPLEWAEMEAVTKATCSNNLPTLSTLCTATSLSGSSTAMLREFDIDSIMELLHQKEYDTTAALATIKASPQEFLTVWSTREKEVFNYKFRKHAGSLRMVLKGISSSKSVQDIVDYHYRFKIPDQFRLFQNKNREQAVRMVESTEERRSINSFIPIDCERLPSQTTLKATGW